MQSVLGDWAEKKSHDEKYTWQDFWKSGAYGRILGGSISYGADKLGDKLFPTKFFKKPISSAPYQLKKQIFKGVKAAFGGTVDIHIDQAIDKLKDIFGKK